MHIKNTHTQKRVDHSQLSSINSKFHLKIDYSYNHNLNIHNIYKKKQREKGKRRSEKG